MHWIARALGLLMIGLMIDFASGAEPEVVSIKTGDRFTIAGDLRSAGTKGAPAVVALHMHDSDRAAWGPLAESLQEAGFDVLAVDMRGYGASAKQRGSDISKKVRERNKRHYRAMWRDAEAAYEFLVERGSDPDRVLFAGAGIGCHVALDAACREPRVLGAVLLTPEADRLGIDTPKHMKTWGARPLLVLAAEAAKEPARAIEEAVGESAVLEVLEDTEARGTKLLDDEKVTSRVLDWLKERGGAGIYVDGDTSQETDGADALGYYDMMENGKGEPFLKETKRWLYVAMRMEPGTPPPERFHFAWAPEGDETRARRITCTFAKRGATFVLEALQGGRWKAIKDGLPKGARLGVSSKKAVELLVPRRLEGLAAKGPLHIALGLALRAGSAVSALPQPDHEMVRVADWLEYDLEGP